jgi:hypothetical protein
MTKRLLAKVGTYTNAQNEQKNEYVKLGILKQGDQGGEYMILDPSVNLAGVLLKQNALAAKEGKPSRDAVMVSVFENDNQQQGQNQGGFQQPQRMPTMAQQQGQQQGGFNQQQATQFSDDVPF